MVDYMPIYEILFAGDVIDTVIAESKDYALEIAEDKMHIVLTHVEYDGRNIYYDVSDEEAMDISYWIDEQLTARLKRVK